MNTRAFKPLLPNYLHRGLLEERSRGDGSKIWPKFEGAHEGEEQAAYPLRGQ